jgi:formylglycine-generating enzyme required for sulfatase activity
MSEHNASTHTADLNPTVSLEMIWVEPGTFTMGLPRLTHTVHEVTLTKGFYLGKYEVTQAQYEAVMAGNTASDVSATPSYFSDNPNAPVEQVSYNDVQLFLNRLNQQQSGSIPAGWEYTLPTEAEWEYSCRAGTTTFYSWGDSISASDANWNHGNDANQTENVGQYSANPWGFFDMHGNVLEMTSDFYAPYTSEAQTDPKGPATDASGGQSRVKRGGAWGSLSTGLESAYRSTYSTNRNYQVGFRVTLREIPPGPYDEALEKATAFEQLKALSRYPTSSLTGDLPSEKLIVAIDTDFSLLSERIYGPHKPSAVSVVNQSLLIPHNPESIEVGTDPYPTSSIDVISSPRDVKSLEIEFSPDSVSSVTVYIYDPNVEDTDSDTVVDANDYFWKYKYYNLTKSELDNYVQKYDPLGSKSRVCRPNEIVRWTGSTTTLSGHTYTNGEYYRVNTVNSNLYIPSAYTITLISKDEVPLSHVFTPLNDEGNKFIRIISPDLDSDGDGIVDVSDYFASNVDVPGAYEFLESWPTDTTTNVSIGDVIKYVGDSIYPDSNGGTYDDSIIKNEYYIVTYIYVQGGTQVFDVTNRFGDSPSGISMAIDLNQRNRLFYKKTPPPPPAQITSLEVEVLTAPTQITSLSVLTADVIAALSSEVSLEMIWVEPGTFMMGQDGVATPVHEVTLTQGFYLGKYEVTQAQYEAVMTGNTDGLSATPSQFGGNPNRPVEKVSWDDAQKFLTRLNEQQSGNLPNGWAYALPTEAEWEYACRAGTTTAYSWGDAITSGDANYNWDGDWNTGSDFNRTRDVGQYSANPWGFFDMHGNVWEYCADAWGSYATGAQTDPFNVGTTGSDRVRRGGSWSFSGPNLRSASRKFYNPSNSTDSIGFRVALREIS